MCCGAWPLRVPLVVAESCITMCVLLLSAHSRVLVLNASSARTTASWVRPCALQTHVLPRRRLRAGHSCALYGQRAVQTL